MTKGEAVPLSEHEQRILHEIERTFYEEDPAFAARVRSETIYRRAGRNCKWSVLAFLAGLALLLATFTTSLVLGLVGFVVMLGAAMSFERHLRVAGRAGWRELSESMRNRRINDTLGATGRRLRERFRRA